MTLLAAGRYSSKSEKIVLKVGTGTIEGRATLLTIHLRRSELDCIWEASRPIRFFLLSQASAKAVIRGLLPARP